LGKGKKNIEFFFENLTKFSKRDNKRELNIGIFLKDQMVLT